MKLAERLVVLCGGFQVLTWRRLKFRVRYGRVEASIRCWLGHQ